jgi:biopolymer transport protein TolR
MAGKRRSRKPVSEINVVPYIDVMLVLLVIFMVTAPLISQGVNVDLPQADSEPLPPDREEPLIVSVDKEGRIFINVGENPDQPLAAEEMQLRVAAVLRNKPNTPVLVRGDQAVNYGAVVKAMVQIQAAGASNLGLMTETPEY